MSDDLSYLKKTDIDKSFKKLKKDSVEFIEKDYDKCCAIIKKISDEIISKDYDYITILDGNKKSLTEKYKREYIKYLENFEKRKKERFSYYRPVGNPYTKEEYVKSEFNSNFKASYFRLEKYAATKKEEMKSIYFNLYRYTNSQYEFSFCGYFNEKDVFCLDKLTFKGGKFIGIETVKISPEMIKSFIDNFLILDKAGEKESKKKQMKAIDNRIKKEKVDNLKQKAGIINIDSVMKKIDCKYRYEKLKTAVKIHIILKKGYTTIRIPQKNIKETLEYLPEFVESILKADKLNVNFKHLQQ